MCGAASGRGLSRTLRKPLLILLVGLSQATDLYAQSPDVSEHSVFFLHSKLTLLTPTPHLVSKALAELCVAAPPPHVLSKEIGRAGPHANTAVNLYASPGAVESMAISARQFAEGTIILKQKIAADGSVVAVGGMVKRFPGYDHEHGNWEYFYSDRSSGFTKGIVPSCVQCHAKAKATDYVYTILKLAR